MSHNSEAIFDRLEAVTLALIAMMRNGVDHEATSLLDERERLISELEGLVDTPFFSARMARVRADDDELTRAAADSRHQWQNLMTQEFRDRRSLSKYRSVERDSGFDQAS